MAIGASLLVAVGCLAPRSHPQTEITVPLLDRIDASERDAEKPDSEAPASTGLSGEPTLDDYRVEAAARNAGLRALYHEWRAQVDRAPQARALPEPRLSYTEFLRSVQTRTGPQERSFALMQSFPWFGKLRLAGSIRERKADEAWQRFIAAQLALDEAFRAAWAEYYFLGRSVEITRDNLDLLERLESVVREKYAAGAPIHPDLIRLQVEVGRLEDRLETLLDRKRPSQARINTLLSRPVETDVAWPARLWDEGVAFAPDELAAFLEEHNPELARLRLEIERSELARELARKEYYPDFALGVQTIATGGAVVPTTPGSGDDPWMLSLSLELPVWWSKYRAGEREAEARSVAARHRRADTTNRLESEVELSLYEFRDADRRVELYGETLIRKAEESLASTEASFQADSSDFLDLIDAERVLLEFQLALERARADRLRARAKLDRLLGRYEIGSDGAKESEMRP